MDKEEKHWMPLERLRYVQGVCIPIMPIDEEKEKKLNHDDQYKLNNGEKE